MKISFLSIGFLVYFFSLSCTSFQKNMHALEKCKVTVTDIQLPRVQAFGKNQGIQFRVSMEVFNPNNISVELNQFDLTVYKQSEKNAIELAHIVSSSQLTIPPMTKKTMIVDVETKKGDQAQVIVQAILQTIADVLQNKRPVFILQGTIQFSSLIGNINVPIRFVKEAKL